MKGAINSGAKAKTTFRTDQNASAAHYLHVLLKKNLWKNVLVLKLSVCGHIPEKLKQSRWCIYLHVHRCVSACLYMQVYNSNRVGAAVYLCMRVKLGKFERGSSQAGGCEGGRFVVWVGGGASCVSSRRWVKRRAVQREAERACACAFQGVLFVQGCPNIYRALAAVECRGRAGTESSSRGKPLLSSTSAGSFPLGQSVNADGARDVWA